jgi:hypothetical protein
MIMQIEAFRWERTRSNIISDRGHTALLNEMMKYNQQTELVLLADVLK